MKALALLMGLLALAYLGSSLVDRRALRGLGLSSGLEVVGLGFLVGPPVLGGVDRAMLDAFAPIAHVALGWLALVLGLELATALVEPRAVGVDPRVRWGGLLGGVAGALAIIAAMVVPTVMLLERELGWPRPQAVTLALALAATGCETTRQGLRWAVARHEANGPVTRLLTSLAQPGVLVPALLTGVLFAVAAQAGDEGAAAEALLARLGLSWGWVGWLAITLGLGALVGAIGAVLLGREPRLDESWGVLLGTSSLAIGIALRLQLSTLAVCFVLGLVLATLCRQRSEILAMVLPTERAVLLPALLLAGARLDANLPPGLGWVLAVAFMGRVAAQMLFAVALLASRPRIRPAGPALSFAFLPPGSASFAVALALALRFPGVVATAVLLLSAASAVVGESVGTWALRSALARAGEVRSQGALAAEDVQP